MKVALNLLNYKSYQMGGVESFAKNLVKGFISLEHNVEFIYYINSSASPRFSKLKESDFKGFEFDINPNNILGKTLFQKYSLNRLARRHNIDVILNPQPFLPVELEETESVSVFHDFQHKTLPSNFSMPQRIWRRYQDYVTVKNSDALVTISEFTREKLKSFFDYENEVKVIPNPIQIIPFIPKNEQKSILTKYGLESKSYYYTISSSAQHKNLSTLIRLFRDERMGEKLVITGPKRAEHEKLLSEKGSMVKFTGYIDELEKNTLIKNCKVFLFPSTYEVFGMPPIEALLYGKKVLTTKNSAIPETTKGYANYVESPKNIEDWLNYLEGDLHKPSAKEIENLQNEYSVETVARSYLELFQNLK